MNLSDEDLGKYLKDLRIKANLSTRQVYDLAGVSNGYLSLVEHGKRRASAIVLKKLAPFYNVDYMDLYEKAGYVDLIEEEKYSISKRLPYVIENEYGLNSMKLLNYYKELNNLGKKKALENMKDLTEVPKYTNKDNDVTNKKNNIQEA